MDKMPQKPGASEPQLASGDEPLSNQLKELISLLRKEVEHLRSDRDELRDRVVELEQSQAEEREQWKEEREQWKDKHEKTQTEIEGLKKQLKDLSLQLKKSQGIDPSSEKGRQLANASSGQSAGGDGGGDGNGKGGLPDDGGARPESKSHKQRYFDIFKNRKPEKKRSSGFQSEQDFWQAIGSDPDCIPSKALIFSSKVFEQKEETKRFEFSKEEKLRLFGRESGLHSKTSSSTVYRLDLALTKMTCIQESLSSHEDGIRYSKTKSIGPAGTQMSWETLAVIATLVAEYAFPMERLAKAIGHSYLSSGNISRWFVNSAHPLIPIYIAMGKALAHSRSIRMDDTSSKVLEMRRAAQKGLTADRQLTGYEWDQFLDNLSAKSGKNGYLDLLRPVYEAFGRVSSKARSDDAKKSINVTLISGKLDQADHDSMVYFYRTHFGQAGNLLSRILEHRPAHKPGEILFLQSDCSNQNNLEAEVAASFKIMKLGCTSHARREIYRHREKDPNGAFFLLRCFAALARMTELTKNGPMTRDRILRIRTKYGRRIWALILSTCRSVIKGKSHPLAKNRLWKKGDKIFEACSYILRNRKALIVYLNQPELGADNDAAEQALRGEKLIESASHFRNSENGRVALDIHRSMIASCNACGLEYRKFLRIISETDPELIQANSEQYFPNNITLTLHSRDPPEETAHDDRPAIYH